MKFFTSLVEAGYPKESLAAGNVKVLIGLKCHINQVVQERKGLVRTGKNADRPTTALLVTKIHSLPGADTKSASKAATTTKAAVGGKANGKAAPTPAADVNDEIDTTLTEKILEALAETDPLPKKSCFRLPARRSRVRLATQRQSGGSIKPISSSRWPRAALRLTGQSLASHSHGVGQQWT